MLGVPLVLILAVAYSCAGSSSKPLAKTSSTSTDGPTPGNGTISPSVMPTGAAPPGNSYPTAPVSGGSPAAGGSPGSGTGGTTGGASGGSTGGGGAGTSTNAAGSGAPCSLSLVLTLDKNPANGTPAYPSGQDPKFTVTAQNNGTGNCLLDMSSKGIVITVTDPSASIPTVWAGNICTNDSGTTDNSTDERAIGPGQSLAATVTWSRTKSASGCPQNPPSAGTGTFEVSAAADGVTSASVQFALQ